MKTRISCLLAFSVVLVAGLGSASHAVPSVQLRTEVSPEKATIGDPIVYKVTVIYSSHVALVPSSAPANMGEFEIRGFLTDTPKPRRDGKLSAVQTLTVVSFSTGAHTIPSLTLHFASDEGSLSEVATKPVTVEIISLLEKRGDEGGLRPVKGFYGVPSYLWMWIVGALVLLALLIYAFVRWNRRKRAQQSGSLGPVKPAEEIAWDLLHTLEFSDWIEKGLIKDYYSQLSYILRLYLENRYGISALELTTSELWGEIRRLNLPNPVVALLRAFLDTADLVKFAKFRPGSDDIEIDLNQVKKIITLCTPEVKKSEEVIPA